MKLMPRLAVVGAFALAACSQAEEWLNSMATDETQIARNTIMIGIDVSGSFHNSGSYDDAIQFAAHYIEAHLNGFGGLQVATDVFVGSVGGKNRGEAKTFHPIHDFIDKDQEQIETCSDRQEDG